MDALTEKDKILRAYEDKMAEIHTFIDALTVWVEDMGGISPDAVTQVRVDEVDEVLKKIRGAATWAGVDRWKGVA